MTPAATAVDLFAGCGGFTEAAEQCGIRVVWAGNHWKPAVEAHERNHPHTLHKTQDLHQADWRTLPPFDIGIGSPECTGHTPSRGVDRPHHDTSRSTAWAMVSLAEARRPAVLVVENVPEFTGWVLFPAWSAALTALGYAVSTQVIDAADVGVPQNRERLFVVATRSRHPLVIPQPDRDHVPVSTVLDWEAGRWSPIPGHAPKTLARIARARREGHRGRFVVPYYGSGSGLTGRSTDRPIGTLTTIARWALIDDDRDAMRMLSIPEARAVAGFRPDYWLPANIRTANKLLGNSVPPALARHVLERVVSAA